MTEDYFGMGTAWRQKKQQSKRPMTNPVTPQATPGTPKESIPINGGRKQITAGQLLEDLATGKTDAPSFGDLYQRPHDGDTAKTSRAGGDDMSLSSHESDGIAEPVTLANIPAIGTRITMDGDASTAKSSIHYRLQRDKSREIAAKSQEESRQLLETLQSEREELQKTREELERLRNTTNKLEQLKVTPTGRRGTPRIENSKDTNRDTRQTTRVQSQTETIKEAEKITPSATRGGTGTAADSAGTYK